MARRRLVSVVGSSDPATPDAALGMAEALGRALVDGGYRVMSGGLGGVMEAAFRGARSSARHRDGDTVAVLPGLDEDDANPHADIRIPTGLGHLRNGVVAASPAVVVVCGAAGTLSEMGLAWRMGRLVVALKGSGGIADEYAGRPVDGATPRPPEISRVLAASSAAEAVRLIDENIGFVLRSMGVDPYRVDISSESPDATGG